MDPSYDASRNKNKSMSCNNYTLEYVETTQEVRALLTESSRQGITGPI